MLVILNGMYIIKNYYYSQTNLEFYKIVNIEVDSYRKVIYHELKLDISFDYCVYGDDITDCLIDSSYNCIENYTQVAANNSTNIASVGYLFNKIESFDAIPSEICIEYKSRMPILNKMCNYSETVTTTLEATTLDTTQTAFIYTTPRLDNSVIVLLSYAVALIIII